MCTFGSLEGKGIGYACAAVMGYGRAMPVGVYDASEALQIMASEDNPEMKHVESVDGQALGG